MSHSIALAARIQEKNGSETLEIPKTRAILECRRIAVVLFSEYPADPRPRRAAEAFVKEGAEVEVICLSGNGEEQGSETFNGVRVTRMPLKHRRGGILNYLFEYGTFLFLAGVILATRTARRRYDIVHVHNMPDFLVFSALVPKLLGARVILDMHDPVPELMTTIYGFEDTSLAVKVFKICERWSFRFADAILTVNQACKNIFTTRSCSREKITVVMNAPDEQIFADHASKVPERAQRDFTKPFVIMYHGSLVERHGLDLAIAALEKIQDKIPQIEFRIYGRRTPFLDRVLSSIENSRVSNIVRYLGPKRSDQIVEAIREADLGIIPNQRSVFTELNTPTRIFEYLSQGKPVIAPCTLGILDYFDDTELCFFDLGNADDLAMKIVYVFSHSEEIRATVERGQKVYRSHMWSQERTKLIGVAGTLLEKRAAKAVR